jgi:DNA replication and repair protein RecF
MYLRHLSLLHYRNYARLDLALPPGLSVFWGNNGEGKSNLIEAVYLLATSRSFRTSSERDLVNWFADTQPVFARVAGEVVRHGGATRLEVILAAPANDAAEGEGEAGRAPAASIRRRVRVNGNDRPVVELLGQLNAVLFSPEDVELVAGPAELRRRYLDITLCQIDQRYVRALRRYQRVLTQRNALLRQTRDRPASPEQFEFWDVQVTDLGAELALLRLRAIGYLNERLQAVYPRLTSDSGALKLVYRSLVPLDEGGSEQAVEVNEEEALAALRARYAAHFVTLRPRERAQGVTVAGPHRDDVAFLVNGIDLRTYGSRGQQRTAALALKLAETELMETRTGERPVLLLDDVMSELDPVRRKFLQSAVAGHEQVLMTTTDLTFFEPEFLARATRVQVQQGQVSQAG